MAPLPRLAINLPPFLTLVFIFWLAGTTTGHSSPEETLTPPDIEEIVQRGTLKVAMYHRDSPPFYYKNSNGNMEGIDVSLVRGLAHRLGVDVVFDREGKTFEDVVNRVASRKADLGLSKMSMTFSRAMRVRFSVPYLNLHQALLVNRLTLSQKYGNKDPDGQFKGRLAVLSGSSYVDNAKDYFPHAEIVELDNWETMVAAVLEGSVVALHRDDVEIGMVLKNNPQSAIKLKKVVLKNLSDPKVIMIPWSSPNLLALVNYYLTSLDINLTEDRILNKTDEVLDELHKKTSPKNKDQQKP